MLRTSALILTGSLAIGLTACGSSGSKNGGAGGGAPSSTGDGSSATTAATGGGAGGSSEIADLVRKARTANVRVTYKTTASDTMFTLAQFNGDSSMASGDSTIVTSGAKTYSCSGQGAGAMCTELPGGSAIGGSLLTAFFGAYSALISAPDSLSGKLGFVDKTTSTATIAGRDAKCATIKAGVFTGASGELKVCIDAQTGILLRGETSVGGQSSTIEATEFKESSAADVKLPAQPTQMTMPTMPTIPNVTQPSY